MAIASLILVFVPHFVASMLAELLYGLGYGCFTAVVWALWTEIISMEAQDGTSTHNSGNAKDMGYV